jgi:hypothetical protein
MEKAQMTTLSFTVVVAKCEVWGNAPAHTPRDYTCCCGLYVEREFNPAAIHIPDCRYAQRYSTDWAQGGPIIERERICLEEPGCDYEGRGWGACIVAWSDPDDNACVEAFGPTALVAAMRCYVMSKLGAEVEVPNKLVVSTA